MILQVRPTGKMRCRRSTARDKSSAEMEKTMKKIIAGIGFEITGVLMMLEGAIYGSSFKAENEISNVVNYRLKIFINENM